MPRPRVPEELQIPLNSAIGLDPRDAPAEDTAARTLGPSAREGLVVLTHDPALVAAVRAVAAAEHGLVFVGAEADLTAHLIADAAGVVVLDTSATVSSIAQLTQSLKAQFPDVVLIVTGGAVEQSALSAQVSSGDVYRFLHKPASEPRIRLFIDAAWRRRGARGTSAVNASGTPAGVSPLPLRTLAVAVLAVACAAGIGGWLLGQRGARVLAPRVVSAPRRVAPVRPSAADAALGQLLEHADAALARGDWLLPPGTSAADLYHQALERHPGDAQALAGLDKVVDHVLSAAEQDLLAQHLEEAEHLTAAARAIAPQSVRVAFLVAQIARERERAMRTQARLQLQQQQADELARQQEMIAAARAALTAGNLDEAARSIDAAAAAGVDRDAIDTLTRDLHGAQLIVRMKEALAHPTPALTPDAAAAAQPPAAAVPEPPSTAPQQVTTAASDTNPAVMAGTLERLRYVAPEYPASARANGTSGWVDLSFDVETDGTVANIAVTDADPKKIFDEAAAAAVRKWRYQPAERGGHAVVQRARLRIRFALQ